MWRLKRHGLAALTVIYEIDEVAVHIPSLVIQPLVENAIIHGILKVKGPEPSDSGAGLS